MCNGQPQPHLIAPAPAFSPEWTAYSLTRPDRMALSSWLHHGPLPPPQPFRSLHIGLTSVGNLIAQAFYYPESFFAGVDPRPAHVATASEIAAELGLSNVELTVCDVTELAKGVPSDQPFDYIVAQELFCWLSDAERAALLAFGAARLARQGLLALDFEVFPGALTRQAVAMSIMAGAPDNTDPLARIAYAQEEAGRLLGILSDGAANRAYAAVTAIELKRVVAASPGRVHRYYLDPTHRPLTLRSFVTAAERAHLRYVVDAAFGTALNALPPPLIELAKQRAIGGVELDGLLDRLRGEPARSVILCRADAPPSQPPTLRQLQVAHLASSLLPVSGEPDLHPSASETFRTPQGEEVTTSSPILKAMLTLVAARQPAGIVLRELFESATDILRQRSYRVAPDRRVFEEISDKLLYLHARGAVELRLFEPPLARGKDRGLHALARFELSQESWFDDAVVGAIESGVPGLQIAQHFACGNQERQALLNDLVKLAERGEVTIGRHGVPITNPSHLRPLAREAIDGTIAELDRFGLLVN